MVFAGELVHLKDFGQYCNLHGQKWIISSRLYPFHGKLSKQDEHASSRLAKRTILCPGECGDAVAGSLHNHCRCPDSKHSIRHILPQGGFFNTTTNGQAIGF